jgi:hypothetical protein
MAELRSAREILSEAYRGAGSDEKYRLEACGCSVDRLHARSLAAIEQAQREALEAAADVAESQYPGIYSVGQTIADGIRSLIPPETQDGNPA